LSLEIFKEALLGSSASTLANEYLNSRVVTAFPTDVEYDAFKSLVTVEVPSTRLVAVVGTGNWRYSLNPGKEFKEFDETSDIDVAIVSPEMFRATWDNLRDFHRVNWATTPNDVRLKLRRNGENVYCGFVTPAWILDRRSPHRYAHKSMLNRLSNQSPGRREVKIMYFKDEIEAVDYYSRGFEMGQRKLGAV
jgi:hypothetical protein